MTEEKLKLYVIYDTEKDTEYRKELERKISDIYDITFYDLVVLEKNHYKSHIEGFINESDRIVVLLNTDTDKQEHVREQVKICAENNREFAIIILPECKTSVKFTKPSDVYKWNYFIDSIELIVLPYTIGNK